MKPLLIKNGRIVDPSQKLDAVGDVYLVDGKVEACGGKIDPGSDRGADIFDATGLLVTPGWVDIHTHLREPGFSHKETIATGTRAAAAGGFTAIACMANTNPVNDSSYVTSYLYQKIASESVIQVYVIGAITKGLQGEELAEIGAMAEAGIVALSDDGKTVMNSYVMRKALDYSKRFDLPVITHCEDSCLKGRGVMNEGFNSARYGLRGIPAASEEIIIARDLELAALTGSKLHIAHVSTKGGIRLIHQAKDRGLVVSGEATPHHLTLTDDAVGNYDTNTKVAPPLREEEDREALRKAVCDGTIDALATDHAPHSVADKEVEYDEAEFGMVGLETAFPLYLRLHYDNGMPLSKLIEAMTSRPASIIGVPKGTLKRGADGDVTVADLNATWKVDKTRFLSKSSNTPFNGWEMRGRVALTVAAGKIVYRRGSA